MTKFIEIEDGIKVKVAEDKNLYSKIDSTVAKLSLKTLYENGFEVSKCTLSESRCYANNSKGVTLLTAIGSIRYTICCYITPNNKMKSLFIVADQADCDYNRYRNCQRQEAIELLIDKGLINKKLFFNLDFFDWDENGCSD